MGYGYWHSYAKFEHEKLNPRYAFGHGLSYARYTYRALTVRRTPTTLEVSVAVRNDGTMAAREVVQCYIGFPGSIEPRAAKSLKAFASVMVAPGETRIVTMTMTIAIDDLRYRDPTTHGWKLESGRHRVLVGGSSDGELLRAEVTL